MATYRMIHDEGCWYIIEKKFLFWWKYERLIVSDPLIAQKHLDDYVEKKKKVYYAKT